MPIWVFGAVFMVAQGVMREPDGGGRVYSSVAEGSSMKATQMNRPTDVLLRKPLILALAVGGVMGGVLAMPAMGQNALGDGRGLEANPRAGSGGQNYQRPSLEREVQFRNAIATGNAPGGLSFRGDVGYQAPGEFSGTLGSDALYSFRRDSLYSGLAGMGIRGTDALQYQFSMTTGSRVTRNLHGNLGVSRFDGASSSAYSGFNSSGTNNGLNTGLGTESPVDMRSRNRMSESITSGTLRSVSSYSSTASLVPELVSVFDRGIEQAPYGLVASPLLGLVSTPMDDGRPARRPAGSQPIEPMKTSYRDTIDEVRARAEAIRQRTIDTNPAVADPDDPNNPSDPADPNALSDSVDQWISDRLNKLQRDVMGIQDPSSVENLDLGQPSGDDADADGTDSPVKIIDPLDRYEEGEGIEGGSIDQSLPEIGFSTGEGISGNTRYAIDPDTLELIRGDGKRITYLIDPTAGDRNIYTEHMIAGERLLRNGRYFDAEERFTNAISVRQGDVTAQLGRLHAQIGAGLVVSGAVNLQTLMSEHMEVVSRRYSGDLLPSPERLRGLLVILRERAGLDERPAYEAQENGQVRISCGLLISYLGYQLDDEEQMLDGFSVLRELGTDSDLRLLRLLETVWGAVLEEDQKQLESSEPDSDEMKP